MKYFMVHGVCVRAWAMFCIGRLFAIWFQLNVNVDKWIQICEMVENKIFHFEIHRHTHIWRRWMWVLWILCMFEWWLWCPRIICSQFSLALIGLTLCATFLRLAGNGMAAMENRCTEWLWKFTLTWISEWWTCRVCVCVKITDDDSRWEQNFVNNMFSRVFASPSIVCSLLRVTDANDCFCECWCWRNQSFTRMHTAHMLQVRLIKYMANDGFHCKIAHCFRSRADQPSGGPCFPNTWISWLSW